MAAPEETTPSITDILRKPLSEAEQALREHSEWKAQSAAIQEQVKVLTTNITEIQALETREDLLTGTDVIDVTTRAIDSTIEATKKISSFTRAAIMLATQIHKSRSTFMPEYAGIIYDTSEKLANKQRDLISYRGVLRASMRTQPTQADTTSNNFLRKTLKKVREEVLQRILTDIESLPLHQNQ